MKSLAEKMAHRAAKANMKQARKKLTKIVRARRRSATLDNAPKPRTYRGAQRLYGTNIYKAWRRYVFARDDYQCQLCGAKKVKIEAHHILPKRKRPDLTLDKNNGITLCKECHHGIISNKEDKFVYAFSLIVQMNTYRYTRREEDKK